MKSALREKALLDAGKLHTLGSLFTGLKAQPDKEPLTLPAPSNVKLDPADLHDRMLDSTFMVGLYYHCADCHQMHSSTGTGFAVAEGGVVTTCAHIMTLDPKKMTQAYPVVVNSHGDVFPVDRIIAYDPVGDTVLVHAEGLNAPPLPMRSNARVGESVYCLGHPGENMFIFTTGIVSRVDTRQKGQRAVRSVAVSCEYSPGSSGCPIADASGNVLAQAAQIFPQLMDVEAEKAPGAHHPTTTYATVYNLHSATASVEIARLADPATRPAYTEQPPVAADDAKAASPSPATAQASPIPSPTPARVTSEPAPAAAQTTPSPSPASDKDGFNVHAQYDIVVAPTDIALDEITSFKKLYEKSDSTGHKVMVWGRGKPSESITPNYLPVGFTGVTGYFEKPGSSGPITQDNSITRGIEFTVTFHDRTDTEVGTTVKVNDNRDTPEAADNVFKVEAKLAKGAFTLVKLGPPQKDGQAWLAIQVDQFDVATSAPIVSQGLDGKLPADKKVDLKFTAADGQEIDTTKMRGKVILVDFWATWCGPCVAALPRIQELYDKYHKDGLEILGINLDEDRSAMDPFLRKHPHPWPQSISAPSGKNPLADRFEIHGIPFFLLIDKQGVAQMIEARNPSTDDLVASLLKQ